MDYKDKKCLVGVPSGSGFMPAIMVQSLLQLHKPLPCAFITVERQRTDKARNYMVQQCLVGGFDYLLMIDDDNPVPPETLEKMLADDKDIVIATILSRNPDKDGKYNLCAFYSHLHKIDGKWLKLYDPIETFRDEGDLHKIDAGGTGCILIKRKVLEKLYVKYAGLPFEFGDIKFKKKVKINGVDYDRRTMSEDCEFSERAINEGFEMWLDETITPIHLGRIEQIKYIKK